MKDIEGFEGRYAITSCGKVWSYLTQKFLIPKVTNGYAQVDLFDTEHRQCPRSVHRLVAQAYLTNPNNFPCVNHKDEVRTNNCVNNLEWCSYSYNNKYNGRAQKAANKRTAESRQSIIDALVAARSKPVICVETGVHYSSAAEAGRKTNANGKNIGSVCRGKLKRAGGYHWRFAG